MAEREKRRATTFRTSRGAIVNVAYPDIYIAPSIAPGDVTSPAEMREALRETLKGITKRSGGGGLEYEIWFNKQGYTPHYAEHVVDPTDEKEKLVMADPHSQRKAFIYDLETGEIEWEFAVPGTVRPNPHTARMLMTDVPNFGIAGDIYCCDRDQNVIVVDRATKTVKFSKKPAAWAPSYLHEAMLGVDNASLILTDYHLSRVSKVTLPGMAEVWTHLNLTNASKVSIIRGVGLLPSPSFGGEYLVATTWAAGASLPGSIFEIKDSDGSTVWRNPNASLEGAWINTPHSAFRMGREENYGAVTVVGSEAGGGIYALNYYGRPVWAIPSSAILRDAANYVYYSVTSRGLGEITHVFPTLDGRIGFCAWSGLNSAIVGIITHLPLRQEGEFVLALGKASTNAWVYLDPPIRAEEWDENLIVVKNTGVTNSLNWKVDAYPHSYVNLTAPTTYMVPVLPSSTVVAGGFGSADLVHPYKWYRMAVQSTTPGSPTTYDVYVTQRRS